MFFKEFETDRLILKNISKDDRAFILRQFSNDRMNEFLFDAEPLKSLEEADEIIDFYLQPEPREQHRWVLILKSNGSPIGTCGFHCWDRKNNQVDIGYDLQEEHWGQGLMTEALQAILLFAENKMNVEKINAHIYVDNARSIKIAKKLGFIFSGETEICVFRDRKYLHNIYSFVSSFT